MGKKRETVVVRKKAGATLLREGKVFDREDMGGEKQKKKGETNNEFPPFKRFSMGGPRTSEQWESELREEGCLKCQNMRNARKGGGGTKETGRGKTPEGEQRGKRVLT